MMDAEIDANAPLDYIEFHIFPSQNRYEACACGANKIEKVTSGLLEHLLVHSAEVKALHSKGSNAKYKLKSPENHDIQWFTKFVLIRFLHIISSANILGITNSVKNEISQLEEAHKFHLSLYAKGTDYQHRTGESGNSHSNGTGPTHNAEGSDASKNELLKAMDLRLTALRGELIAAFDQAACSTYSVEEMTDIEFFSHHFGSIGLRDSLHKYLELRQENLAVDNSSSKPLVENDNRVPEKQGYNHTPELLPSEMPVKYGVSPAKAAQAERQSSTESDESSFSSEEERPFKDRSRSLIISASPRRSASPMRRVQIRRSGPRRSTSIAIKSLNYFPTRERSLLPEDPANDSDHDVTSQQPPRKSENNVRRMSVQDAISLFENKQKDQTVDDVQKARSLNASMATNKTVPRRWSGGMGEDSSQYPQDDNNNNTESREIENSSPEAEVEAEPELIVASEDNHTESCEKRACSPVVESTNASEKLTASTEWTRQKEAELNELLVKVMETKPAKNQAAVTNSRKRRSLPREQRGGFHDHGKEKRDEKLRGEKKAEKDKQVPDVVRKSRPGLSTASDTGKKNNVKKLQKSEKNESQPENPKTESPKLGNNKKLTPKASSLPTTRKSWPSMPSPKTSEKPIAKTPVQKNPPRRRSQPAPSISRSSLKVETSQPRAKSVKPNQNDTKSSLRSAPERKQQSVTKPSKTAKTKVHTTPKDLASSAKPSLYSKVTKKGSVVPLESKTYLRKGSGGNISTVNPGTMIKKSSNFPEPLRSSQDLVLPEENEAVSNSSDPVVQPEEREIGDSEKCEDDGLSQVDPTVDHDADRVVETDSKAEAEEESTISPTAWVEIEEHEDQPIASPVNIIAPAGVSNARVRHSLSQMLLEESGEQDVVDWGNAENPPPTVYQKDAPKGLKRLLKFARKSKTDANATGQSVFSEGEDDTEDFKNVSRRSSDSLLKNVTLHSKNSGHQKTMYYQKSSTDYEHSGQTNISKFSARSLSQHVQEGHVSASVTTTKATRSFFSLSAFKGSK